MKQLVNPFQALTLYFHKNEVYNHDTQRAPCNIHQVEGNALKVDTIVSRKKQA